MPTGGSPSRASTHRLAPGDNRYVATRASADIRQSAGSVGPPAHHNNSDLRTNGRRTTAESASHDCSDLECQEFIIKHKYP